jgi:DNA-directed RNA polymerase subunit RPC12/RpoP
MGTIPFRCQQCGSTEYINATVADGPLRGLPAAVCAKCGKKADSIVSGAGMQGGLNKAAPLICFKCGGKLFFLRMIEAIPAFFCTVCGERVNPNEVDIQATVTKGNATVDYNLASHGDHAAALGRLVAAWSCVEQALFVVTFTVLRVHPWQIKAAFYSVTSNNARTKFMDALAETMVDENGKFKTKLLQLLGDARTHGMERNKYVHDLWQIGIDPRDVFQVRNPGDHRIEQLQKVQPDEMKKTTAEIMALSRDLWQFAREYGVVYPTPRPRSERDIPEPLRKRLAALFDDPVSGSSRQSPPPESGP